MFGLKRRRRNRLRRQAFPAEWSTAIHVNVRYYDLLTPAEQIELHGHVQVLLYEKPFEGCGGLALTEEIRATIAAQAAILLLGRQTNYYPKLRTILVYPTKYVAEVTHSLPDGTVVEGPEARGSARPGTAGRWCSRGTTCCAAAQIPQTPITWSSMSSLISSTANPARTRARPTCPRARPAPDGPASSSTSSVD